MWRATTRSLTWRSILGSCPMSGRARSSRTSRTCSAGSRRSRRVRQSSAPMPRPRRSIRAQAASAPRRSAPSCSDRPRPRYKRRRGDEYLFPVAYLSTWNRPMHRSSPRRRGPRAKHSNVSQVWAPASAGANGVLPLRLLFHPGCGNDTRPFCTLAADVVGELLWRAAEHVDALLLQWLDHVARLERLVGGARELVDDV